MARPLPLRRSLLRNFLMIVALLSGGILATTFFAAQRTVEVLSHSFMRQAIAHTEARLRAFVDPVQRGLLVARARGEAGLLSADDPDRFARFFEPMIRQHPQITSVMIADARGRESMLLHDGERWTRRETRVDEWGRRSRWLEWEDGAAERIESWKERDYDPRLRPWYAGALGAAEDGGAEVHWTEPYTFFTTGEPGITASVVFDPGDGLQRVIGFDVLLRDVSEFTTGLAVTRRGLAFVLTEDGRVIGLPRDARFDDPEARSAALLRRPAELGLPILVDASRAFRRVVEPVGKPFRFESGAEAWWGQTRSVALSPSRSLLAAVVLPEADLLGDLTRVRIGIAAVTLAVLAVAGLRAVRVARGVSRPVEALALESDRIARGDLEQGEPVVSRIEELSRLAEAQEQMRVALRTLMKMERDLQLAREIQQRTLPARLPALPGFEIDAWSEPAEQTGGDAYDVIGMQGPRGRGCEILPPGAEAERALLLMADAAGHGVGPALSVTQVRAMLRMAARSGEDLAGIARHLNEQLVEDLPAGRFITAWLGELDVHAATLASFSAGQGPILALRADRQAVEERPAEAPPLGIVPDLPIGLAPPTRLEPGDLVAVFSDGIFEASDPSGQPFGIERVSELLVTHRGDDARRILAILRQTLSEFTRGAPATDDRTALLVKRRA